MYSHTPIYRQKKQKKRYKILLPLVLFFVLFSAIFINIDRTRDVKPFFKETNSPLVIAHRGGNTFPENTLLAFSHSEKIGADVLEFDIHMTKDGHLVVMHDGTLDRTTNGENNIEDYTLEEIKQLDAGFYFQDDQGNYPYRNKGITIPTVEEVFEEFPHMHMNIEIKVPKEKNMNIEEKLWQLIETYKMEDKVLLASFEQKIINNFNDIAKGKVAISGGKNEVTKFVLLHKFFLSKLYSPKVDVIQMPTEQKNLNLKDQKLISGAQKLNMQVHYWTINDKEEMRQLLQLGANGIITDKPELLIEVMKELGLR